MKRQIQIVPRSGVQLFGQIVKKEIELRKKQGTFHRSGSKKKDHAKWSHTRYDGWITFERSIGEVVVADIQSRAQAGGEWQLFHAFLGWLDRHFGNDISAINIQYRE